MHGPGTLEERPLPGTDLWAVPSGWPQGVLPASALSLLLPWGPGLPHIGVPVGASPFLTSFPLSKATGSSVSRSWLAG